MVGATESTEAQDAGATEATVAAEGEAVQAMRRSSPYQGEGISFLALLSLWFFYMVVRVQLKVFRAR